MGKVGSSVYGTKPQNKENDVIMILSSLAYITPIRLSFCISTDERESFRQRERENFVFRLKKKKKKKNSKSVRNDFKVEQMIKNDKKTR